ncbi:MULTISPECIES: hypothetical protein [Streptomyces]|uniref:Uncharacterized protein n=1 Tax=Streptomyces ramulosus TaxID=47762 RepID=A0ABW1FLM4_9ACTN
MSEVHDGGAALTGPVLAGAALAGPLLGDTEVRELPDAPGAEMAAEPAGRHRARG